MSEYQYYEFQAVDRPLGEGDRASLRALSTRAQITATSFTNSYEWGSLKADPAVLMHNWFDLHLYLANWGSRRLMIKLPRRLVDRARLGDFLREVDCASLETSGESLILDVAREEIESDDWDDGSGRLAALAPLRADIMAGDLRVFYLLWLTAVEADVFEPDAPEPMPGIGPMTASLQAFVDFFAIDPDLVAAAAERSAAAVSDTTASADVRRVITAIPDDEKTQLLVRVFDGDPHVAAELRARIRACLADGAGVSSLPLRTVGELRARANVMALAREQAAAKAAEAERMRQENEAKRLRRARLDAVARRGDSVWREIEREIECRNAGGYDRALRLLLDTRDLAAERGTMSNFSEHLIGIKERHARKGQFMDRLAKNFAPDALSR